jgi:hypothetical protein
LIADYLLDAAAQKTGRNCAFKFFFCAGDGAVISKVKKGLIDIALTYLLKILD